MALVWETDLNHSQQAILLAMADYASDDGRNCYPSHERLAWKTGYSDRQVSRILKDLGESGIVEILSPATNNHPPHYWIRLDRATPKKPFRDDAMSTQGDSRGDVLSSQDLARGDNTSPQRVDNLSPQSPGVDTMSPLYVANVSPGVDTMSPDPSVNPPIEPPEITDDEDARAHDPIHIAWFETYGAEMPAEIEEAITKQLSKCPEEAILHAIRVSINATERTFKYLKACALNYIPPAPTHNGNGNAYTADLPGVHLLEAPVASVPSTPLAPPMAHDDPWAVAMAELKPSLPGVAQSYLTGSRMERGEDVDGIPFYRIVVEERANAGVDWLNKQVSVAIRRTLSSILRQKIVVEIVAAAQEIAA